MDPIPPCKFRFLTLRSGLGFTLGLVAFAFAILSFVPNAASGLLRSNGSSRLQSTSRSEQPQTFRPSNVNPPQAAPLDANGPGWSIVTEPNLTSQSLQATTCVSASDCWAVGSYVDRSGVYKTLIEHWDGTSWSIQYSPYVDFRDNYLFSVTCSSSSQCWAVGYYSETGGTLARTLIEQWDGTVWSIVTSPNNGTNNNVLYGVACASATRCWATGHYYNGSADKTLIEQWNGTSWSLVTSPNVNLSTNNYLSGVTCASTSQCWAIGYYYKNGSSIAQTLVERWTGSSWSIVSSPNTNVSQNNYLAAITCASTSACWSVGRYIDASSKAQTLIQQWNGTSWAIVFSPNSGTSDNALTGITCTSTTQCWTVGYSNAATSRTLIERWDGNSWVVATSPNTKPTQGNYLNGVACSSTAQCWAVGYYSNAAYEETLIEGFNGNWWSVILSADVIDRAHNPLYDVTCVSASDCWTVGQSLTGNLGYQTLIEHWDGSTWSIVSSPSAGVSGGSDNYLTGVACVSKSDCWAVGYYWNVSGRFQSLIEHWNGNSWSIVPSPNTGSEDNFLGHVACASSALCFAVGRHGSSQALVEQWNGSSWAVVNVPVAGTTSNFAGTTCQSVTDCWAVGFYSTGSGSVPLFEHWDGNSWSIVNSPSTGTTQAFLVAVACTSASNCWALGQYNPPSAHQYQSLIEHWDGNSWSIVSSPQVSIYDDHYLLGVACVSASECWAVGYYYDTSSNLTLTEHWDGNSWSIVSAPNVNGAGRNVLRSVACPSSGSCWAVGEHNSESLSGADYTFIERYSKTVPSLTAVLSRKIHGNTTFDSDLLNLSPAVECRSPGATGTAGVDHKLLFTFANNVTNCGTTTDGSLTTGPDANQCTLDLIGVANPQSVTTTLNNVVDSANNAGNVSVTVGFLLGDTTGDGLVNSADIGLTKSKSGQTVDATNFRNDVNADGSINSADISLVKSRSGTALP